jgi:hypothetical protein
MTKNIILITKKNSRQTILDSEEVILCCQESTINLKEGECIMNVKIEIKLTNKKTGFSVASKANITKSPLRRVIFDLCAEAGRALHALTPHSEEALVLTEGEIMRAIDQLLNQKEK